MTQDRQITADPQGGAAGMNAGPPALTIDWQAYGRYLKDSDLSEADQIAFIETLWSIMVSFVDLGFRLSPVQETCGEIDPLSALATEAAADMVRSEDTTHIIKCAADGHALSSRKEDSAHDE